MEARNIIKIGWFLNVALKYIEDILKLLEKNDLVTNYK